MTDVPTVPAFDQAAYQEAQGAHAESKRERANRILFILGSLVAVAVILATLVIGYYWYTGTFRI